MWVQNKATSEQTSTPYKFTSKELDDETGWYYFGARYYEPRMSVWVSADPAMSQGIYFPTGDNEKNKNLPGMGGVFNSINFNVYHYAGQNPVKLLDPDGNYVIDRLNFLSDKRYEIRFHNKTARTVIWAGSYHPYGSLAIYYLENNNPFRDVHLDTAVTLEGTAISTALDIAGGASVFKKWFNNVASAIGALNTSYGNYTDAEKDDFRQTFLKGAGLLGTDSLKSSNPKMLKSIMDCVDLHIANYDKNIKGTRNDKGLEKYASDRESLYKNEKGCQIFCVNSL